MQRVRPSAPSLADLVPYDPKYLPARVYLNANESPYGLPERVVSKLAEAVAGQLFHRYPDPLAKGLRARIAALNGVGEDNVLLGNGGDELLFDIMLAYGGSTRKLLTAPPSFSSYDLDAKLTHTAIVEVPRRERALTAAEARGRPGASIGVSAGPSAGASADASTAPSAGPSAGASAGPSVGPSENTRVLALDEDAVLERVSRGDIDVVMLASPNNPTGDALDSRFVLELLDATDALILIDHAYVEFADARFDLTQHLSEHANLVILRTFSKAYALAGIRLGYLLGSAQVINELCKVRQPYSVDAFSVLAGKAVLDAVDEVTERTAASIEERIRLKQALAQLPGVTVFASEANFILFRVAGAQRIWQRLYDEEGILLRDFSAAAHLTDCLRVSIGTPQQNSEFLAALSKRL
jgi:histidinol-phosphate aminotransferase